MILARQDNSGKLRSEKMTTILQTRLAGTQSISIELTSFQTHAGKNPNKLKG